MNTTFGKWFKLPSVSLLTIKMEIVKQNEMKMVVIPVLPIQRDVVEDQMAVRMPGVENF